VRFVDTNVLLYAISRDPSERAKAARANALLNERDLALSVQVLQEFYVQATRSSRRDAITAEQAALLVESFLRFAVAHVTVGAMRAAIATQHRFQISYWDATMIEAARVLDCAIVLSEDLGDGQDYDGVRVSNPFHEV
jgi:predicted nucleic acid-binding protein